MGQVTQASLFKSACGNDFVDAQQHMFISRVLYQPHDILTLTIRYMHFKNDMCEHYVTTRKPCKFSMLTCIQIDIQKDITIYLYINCSRISPVFSA